MFQKIINNDDSSQANAPQANSRPSLAQASNNAGTAPSASSAAPQQNGGHRNRLSSDVEIKGSIRFKDELIIDGKVEGEITSTGSLAILENARIRAEIKVGSIVIHGKVHGNITAAQNIELKAGSEVVGDIKAAVLTMEAGAIFVGKSEVGAPTSQPTARPNQGSTKPANRGNAQKSSASKPADGQQRQVANA